MKGTKQGWRWAVSGTDGDRCTPALFLSSTVPSLPSLRTPTITFAPAFPPRCFVSPSSPEVPVFRPHALRLSQSPQSPLSPTPASPTVAMGSPAFVGAAAVSSTTFVARRSALSARPSAVSVARVSRRSALRMADEDESTRVSGADILKQLREDASKDSIPPPRSGTTRDGDGKANIWGVEPTENKQDAKDVVPIPLILSAVFGAAITFFLILPNLPFTNPDQL